jgi:serine/threonine protein kinase
MRELKLQHCRLDGRFDILDCLAHGRYSEIYVARDIAAPAGNPSTVVIKALNTYLQGVPEPELERTLAENFRNEAIALDRVRHPNIINRFGHGTAINLYNITFHYLVLEYMPGDNLGALCQEKRLRLDHALFFLAQISAGVEHVHECGVIHCDIRPENLLLTTDSRTIKIADFGTAQIESTKPKIKRDSTAIYAAPEQFCRTTTTDTTKRRLVKLTPAADIYALAKTTYSLLAGQSPRRFSQRRITEFPPQIADQPWARHVLHVLSRATETQPKNRYQTIREFWDDLAGVALPSRITLTDKVTEHSQRLLRVFLCHSSSDKPSVRALYYRLKYAGVAPWFDEMNLLPGQEWEREIPQAVRSSDIVIACLSREAVSKRGYVQKEIRIALDVADEQPEGAIFIIPLKLEECNVPERLRKWQWINFFEAGAYEKLLQSLRNRADEVGAKLWENLF